MWWYTHRCLSTKGSTCYHNSWVSSANTSTIWNNKYVFELSFLYFDFIKKIWGNIHKGNNWNTSPISLYVVFNWERNVHYTKFYTDLFNPLIISLYINCECPKIIAGWKTWRTLRLICALLQFLCFIKITLHHFRKDFLYVVSTIKKI